MISLIMCSNKLKDNLEGIENWYAINNKHAIVKILKAFKAHMINQKFNIYPITSTYLAITGLFNICQLHHEEMVDDQIFLQILTT